MCHFKLKNNFTLIMTLYIRCVHLLCGQRNVVIFMNNFM